MEVCPMCGYLLDYEEDRGTRLFCLRCPYRGREVEKDSHGFLVMKPTEPEPETEVSAGERKRDAFCNLLRMSWINLRDSVCSPSKVPTWDAIIVTVTSRDQAKLYERQLLLAKQMWGLIANSTVTLVVPDPDGKHIGSDAATLNAIHALALHYLSDFAPAPNVEVTNGSFAAQSSATESFPWVKFLSEKHVLMLHAAGDSKRVPWANPMGKIFLPLPYLMDVDHDGYSPRLFDHILAIASCARTAFRNEGGLLIMSGDVFPYFDASKLALDKDSVTIVTVPVTLDFSSNSLVKEEKPTMEELVKIVTIPVSLNFASNFIVASKFQRVLGLVTDVLEKPTVEELAKKSAIRDGGRVLLDSGIRCVRGRAWFDLLTLGCSCQKEVAAWVPSSLYSYCADDLVFWHFGTSNELLDHLKALPGGRESSSVVMNFVVN